MERNRYALNVFNYIAAFFVGAVISIMVAFNTELGLKSTNEVSIAINQVVGILTLSVIMIIGRKNQIINPRREKSAWWQWFGGLFGLGVLTINYYSVSRAGTTIAMATAVLGQCASGLVFDLTGWMGMQKQRISKKKIASLILSFLGISFMLLYPRENNSIEKMLYGALGILAGALTMIQMVYNSGFAKKKGAFFSARQNVISGLVGIILFMLIAKPEASLEGFKSVLQAPWYILVGGGMLACVVVVGSNMIIPKIPGAASAILLSSGQILMAIAIDYMLYGIFEPSLLIGSIIMLVAIIIGG